MVFCRKMPIFAEREIYMVNEERLNHMIHMAIFDARDGKECRPMMQYARKDYVSLQMLRSFISGTVAFMIMFVAWALCSMDIVMSAINKLDIKGMLTSAGINYAIFMLIYLGATYVIYQMRYTKGRKKVKKYYSHVKQMNKLYSHEDRLKKAEKTDWE